MSSDVTLGGCSAALVTQAEEVAVIEVQPGGAATLPCGIPEHEAVSWFSLQSDHIPARVMDRKLKPGGKTDPVNIRDEYEGRLTPIFNSTHSLQLKNITKADLLIYCCIQSGSLNFGNCTKLKLTKYPGGQHTTLNPDHLHCFILICFILLLCLIFLACYVYNKAKGQRGSVSHTSRTAEQCC